MRQTRLEQAYNYQMANLRRYYASRKQREAGEELTTVKANAWRLAIRKLEKETSGELMKVIRHVYIVRDMTLSGAGQRFLHYSHKKTCELVRDWFACLDRYFFEAVRYV